MYKRKMAGVAGLLIFLAACKQDGTKTFTVQGQLKNAGAKMVYIDEIIMQAGMQKPVDSALLKPDGTFSMSFKTKGENFYYLRTDNDQVPFASVINDKGSVSIKADKLRPDATSYEGSAATTELKTYFGFYNNARFRLDSLGRVFDSLNKANAPDSIKMQLNTAGYAILDEMKREAASYVSNSKSSVMALVALQSSQNSYSPEEFSNSLKELEKRFPESKNVKEVSKSFADQLAAMQQQKAPEQFTGKQAPEISLKDVNGNTVSLSSYKGKYVLVDFWASWCKPCRMENPNVVAAYQKYKNKNFTVLGVSLDENEKAWKSAIEKDGLVWTQTLDENQVAAATYNVQGIPFNILVNPEGVIIGESLRGAELEKKLQDVLK